MNDTVKEDIVSILNGVIGVISEDEIDVGEIKSLSDHTLHDSCIFQDEDSISIAILVYCFFKIIGKKKGIKIKDLIGILKDTKKKIMNDDIEGYRNNIKKLFNMISEIDGKIKYYIEEVIEIAKIKKGMRIFEHGISMGRVSDILGISEWELMNYVGKTNIFDKQMISYNVRDRLNFARKVFGLK